MRLPWFSKPASGMGVPQMQLAVAIDDGDGDAIGQIGHVSRAAGMAAQRRALSAGRDIPQGYYLIAGGRREFGTVRAECNAPYDVVLDRDFPDHGRIRRAPQPDPAI